MLYEATVLSNEGPGYAYGSYNGVVVGQLNHEAAVWDAGGNYTNVKPTGAGWGVSMANAIWGSQIVGAAQRLIPSVSYRASLWNGVNDSPGDITPLAVGGGSLLATDGNNQVGYGDVTFSVRHAYAWSGTTDSAIDLHAAGNVWANSEAVDAWNGQAVGNAQVVVNGNLAARAIFWSALSNGSWVNLHPGGYRHSFATFVTDGYQYGHVQEGVTNDAYHAARWTGGVGGWVDLHPASYYGSFIFGGHGAKAVGAGQTFQNQEHALLWEGETVTDLHRFLPSNFVASRAWGVDPITGDIVGWAYVENGSFPSNIRAVRWSPTPVPEPATMVILGLGAWVMARRKRRS